jgi:hypothetical protein
MLRILSGLATSQREAALQGMSAKEAGATPRAAAMTRPLSAPLNLATPATPATPRPSSSNLPGASSENDPRAAFVGEGVKPTSASERLAGVLESEISNNERAHEDLLGFDKTESAREHAVSVEKEKRLALEEQNKQVLALRVPERAEETSVREHEAAQMEREAAITKDDRDYEFKKQEANCKDRESDAQAKARLIDAQTSGDQQAQMLYMMMSAMSKNSSGNGSGGSASSIRIRLLKISKKTQKAPKRAPNPILHEVRGFT